MFGWVEQIAMLENQLWTNYNQQEIPTIKIIVKYIFKLKATTSAQRLHLMH